MTTHNGTRTGLRTQQVESKYLGFSLLITERSVTVLLDGCRLDVLPCVSTARRFCRGYRRAERAAA